MDDLRLKVDFVIHFQLRAKYHAYGYFANKLINEPLITGPSKTFRGPRGPFRRSAKTTQTCSFSCLFAH